MRRELLDETARQWLDTIDIRAVEAVDKSWPESDSQVIRIKNHDGEAFFVKRFSSSVKYRQAVNAYQNCMVNLEGQVPRLVSNNSQERILLLTDIGGSDCSWEELSPAQRASLLRQAGRFLRVLHNTPFNDEDSMPVGDAVFARAQALQRKLVELKGSSDYLSRDLVAGITDDVGRILPQLNQIKRVPCHRDFWKRNWIWKYSTGDRQGDVHLGVLDLEHARPDLFFFDVMKIWSDSWLAAPKLQQPFWHGYGRQMSEQERGLLKRCAAIHAAQTIIWGVEHQNDEFRTQGSRLLNAVTR